MSQRESEGKAVEIQIYRTKPGQREQFISLFQRVIVPALDASIIGQFRSLDDEDKFVWIRVLDEAKRVEKNDSFFFEREWTTELSNKVRQLLDSWEILLLQPTEASKILP